MKKAFLALALAITCLLPVGLISSPASAATCGSAVKIRQASVAVTINHGGTLGHDTYLMTNDIRYRECVDPRGVFRKIERVFWTLKRSDGGNGQPTDFYRANPNVIGTWNLGTKELDSTPITQTFSWTAPNGTGVNIYASQPSNQRCLGGYVTFVSNGLPDTTKDMPSVCVI